jgi:hypothetical protein
MKPATDWELTDSESTCVLLILWALEVGTDPNEVVVDLVHYGHNEAACQVFVGLAREMMATEDNLAREKPLREQAIRLFRNWNSFSLAASILATAYTGLSRARAEQLVREAVYADFASV